MAAYTIEELGAVAIDYLDGIFWKDKAGIVSSEIVPAQTLKDVQYDPFLTS